MLAYYREHWYLALLLLALFVLAAFICVKAAQSGAKSRARREAFTKQMKDLHESASWFRTLNLRQAQEAAQTQPRRLLDGAAFLLQKQLEQAADLNTAFVELPAQAQMVYALYYLLEDAREGLSSFFRQNGKPLTPAAYQAMEQVVSGELFALFQKEYAAYDGDNEEASLLPEEIKEWDARFAALLAQSDPIPRIGEWVCDNFLLLSGMNQEV